MRTKYSAIKEIELGNYSYLALLLYSIPAVLTTLMGPLAQIVDSSLIGRANILWLAGLGVAISIFNSFTWVFNFIIHASTQLIAESHASDSDAALANKMRTSIFIAVAIGVIFSILAYFLRFPLYNIGGGSAKINNIIDQYFMVRLWGHPFGMLYIATLSIMTGLGKMQASFILVFISTTLNILLSILFLNYFNMGPAGIALGTVISNILGAILSLLYIINYKNLKSHLFSWHLEKEHLFRFGKNSLNLFIRSFFLTMAFFISVKIAGTMNSQTLAAHHILLQFWLFSSFFIDGFAVAGNVLVAKEKGKKNIFKIEIIAKRLLVIGGGLGLVFTAVFWLGSNHLWAIFVSDNSLNQTLTLIWPIIVYSAPLCSLAYIMDGLLFGLEKFSYLKNVISLSVVFIFFPLAYYAYIQTELIYLWLGIMGMAIPRFVAEYLYFRKSIDNSHLKLGIKANGK